MTKMTTLEVVSVKPCNIASDCYVVTLDTNVFGESRQHVKANNPYHAVNRYIKQLAEDYGFVRWALNNNLGVAYRVGYDAGWTYRGADDYRYSEPETAVVEPVVVKPVVETVPEPKKPVLYITNINTKNGYHYAFWVQVSPSGVAEVCPGNPDSDGMTVFDVNNPTEALEKIIRTYSERYIVVDVRDANFFGLAKELFTENLRVELNVSRNGQTLLSKTEYIN